MFQVGQNDVGFPPEKEAIPVGDLPTAIVVLTNEIIQWFSPVMLPSADGSEPEMTQYELNQLIARVRALRPQSKLVAQGRVFWIQ